VRLLLDTHALLWWVDNPALIAEEARLAIANARNEVFVSPISYLEIAIKDAIGKLKVPAAIFACIEDSRFCELPLSIEHAAAVRDLPPLHKDPFDRTLIAQATIERLTLVSRDPHVARYGVDHIVA
jgi:PIN domain nuclease of toxin-antitoxin system